ncbi:MAG: cytochrome c [bacterium]
MPNVPHQPPSRARFGRARVTQVAGITLAAVLGIVVVRRAEPLAARDAVPTFAEDVAPILYKNCTTCHRPGGQGPFSLMEYDSAKTRVSEMRDAVDAGYMPPWHAEGPHGTFRNDRRLADADKQTILRWIDGGAKPGDMKALPPQPVYATNWEIGTPDAIVSMSDEFPVPATGTVEYQYFEVPTNFTEDKWITAIEFKPGARQAVHHVIVFAKSPPPTAVAMTAPAAAPTPRPAGPPPPPLLIRNRAHDLPPEPPRHDSLHPPPRQLGAMIGGTAPGTNVMELPAGTALRLRAGTIITFQMHYTARGHAMMDRSSVGFRFAKEPPEEEIRVNSFVNGSFTIPAGAKDVAVPAEIGFGQAVRVWALLPHTHLRGTRWQYKLEKPDGTSEIILDVPRYDFNWQTNYFFAKPLELPAGSKILSTAWYDNSATNKSNPDASKDVKWGDQTWEEMQFTSFLYSVTNNRLKPPAK